MIDPDDPRVLGGRYQLERELGRGGSATVYLARDLQTGQRVALKLLREELAYSAERFTREIRVMMRLRHPHILPILDSGGVGDPPFYVMPYIEGETLRDRLERERQLSLDEVSRLTAALCSALGYAHHQNVLHRDVKPANVWLAGGDTYLTDFGLALEGGSLSGERITSSGIVAGTSAYMSPEQVSGERRLDHRTDIYSLGCVLYESLAGVRPFQGATEPAIRAMRLTSDPPPLRAQRPGVPPHIEAALARAMAREPADRWESATALERAFRSPVPAGAQQPTRPLAKPRTALLAALIIVVVAVGLLWNRNRSRPGSGASQIGVLVAPSAGGSSDAGLALASRAARSVADVFAQIPKLDVRLEQGPSSENGTPKRAARAPIAYTTSVEVRAPGGARELWLTLTPERERGAVTRHSTALRNDADVDSVAASLAIGALRTIALRDSATLMDTRAAVLATSSPSALANLLQAQRLFGQSDGEGAVRALKRAIVADSTCALAAARLSMVYSWLHHYDSAASAVAAVVRQRSAVDALQPLLRGAFALAMGNADSAVANFQLSVVDDPSNVDGWFGLAESLMHLGWRAGHDAQDAFSTYEAVVRIDSAFAPLYHHAFDLALAKNDVRRARTFLARIPNADATLPSRRIALALATTMRPARDSILRSLTREVRRTLSELVLFFARHAGSPHLADTIALALAHSSRTPDDRLRGLRYRLVLAPSLGRTAEALAELSREQSGAGTIDPWLAALVLAGLADARLIEPQLQTARERLRSALPTEPLATPQDPLWQAGELLVACTLVDLPACNPGDIRRDVARLQLRRDDSDAVVRRWLASLHAAAAVKRADTTLALALLQSGQQGLQETYVAYHPLASFPAHRLLEAELRCAARSPNAAIARLSFQRSESIADAAFAHAPRLRCPRASAKS